MKLMLTQVSRANKMWEVENSSVFCTERKNDVEIFHLNQMSGISDSESTLMKCRKT